MTQAHFTLLSGDGIGPEVMAEAEKIIAFFNDSGATKITTQHALIGGAAYEACGEPLPQETLDAALRSDAVLLACVGGPQWASVAYDKRPEAGLLAIRKQMDLFANLRPAKVFDALVDASTLKREVVEGLDILIVRELTGGVYFGQPRGIETMPNGERRGVNTQVYTTSEIRRVAAVAFEMARLRDGRVTSAEKSNVMESGLLWREEVTKLHTELYSDVALSHMYADNLAMQLCRAPKQFDVIVTDNLFGDILSDEASMLTGSLGMLPSASLGAIDSATGRRRALYEPVHGSAPDIAGQGKANPLAMLLSLAMAYRYSLGRDDLAVRLEQAIERVLITTRTADIVAAGFTAVSTAQMGDAVVVALRG